jgi:hypothetical protein
MPSTGKAMLTMFWDSQGVLLAHFQKNGENMNSASYCEVLLKLRDAIHRKLPGQKARGFLQPSNQGGNSRTTVGPSWTLALQPNLAPSDFQLFGPLKKKHWWQTFPLWWRSWNRGAEVSETRVEKILCCGFWHTGKGMGQVYQCWWRIFREINVFPKFEYQMF